MKPYIERDKLINILKKCTQKKYTGLDNLTPGLYYFYPEIKANKLMNALLEFGGEIAEEDVVYLFDHTLFGSAKKGIIFTENVMAASSELVGKNGANPIYFDQLESADYDKKNYKVLIKYKDGRQIQYDGSAFAQFIADVLTNIIKAHNECDYKAADSEDNFKEEYLNSFSENDADPDIDAAAETTFAADEEGLPAFVSFLDELTEFSPDMLEKLYKRKDKEAGFALAFDYYDEKVEGKNQEDAARILKELAEDFAPAKYVYGFLNYSEMIEGFSKKDGIGYLAEAAEFRIAEAAYLLALECFSTDDGDEENEADVEKGIGYLRLAKETYESDPHSFLIENLGQKIREWDKNLQEAGFYDEEETEPPLPAILNFMDEFEDYTEEMLERLYQRGDIEAGITYAFLMLADEKSEAGINILENLAEKSDKASFIYAMMIFSDQIPGKRQEDSLRYLKKLAEEGNAEAAYAAAGYYIANHETADPGYVYAREYMEIAKDNFDEDSESGFIENLEQEIETMDENLMILIEAAEQ